MSRTRAVIFTSFTSLSLLSGCKTVPLTKQELIGKYEYHEHNLRDKALGTTCFTLKADGTFIAGNANLSASDGPTLPPQGTWQLWDEKRQQTLDLDHSGFPLERDHALIRALVNDDLGTSCVLSK